MKEKITVILLGWRRPVNMSLILKSLYSSKNVDEIILWNNNPKVIYPQKHAKLLTINTSKNIGFLARWLSVSLARNNNILFLDDDLLLASSQIEILFKSYISNPNRIYGCFGRNLEKGKYLLHPASKEADIILGRTMLFHRSYVYKFLPLIQGRTDNLHDDILFSLSFKRKHTVVDVGEIIELVRPYAFSKQKKYITLRQEVVDFCIKKGLYTLK